MSQDVLKECMEQMRAFLEWSETHQGATLRVLEEQLERTMQGIRGRLMEAGIAQQGPKGYRARQFGHSALTK